MKSNLKESISEYIIRELNNDIPKSSEELMALAELAKAVLGTN